MRIGIGYDVHQLAEGYDLWIGGVKVPHFKGAVGHSDADVLLHAICDAILGALALGDIGTHFPDTDPKYKGIDSKILLSNVFSLIQAKGWKIGNIDSTVCLQQPKVKPFIPLMVDTIEKLLNIEGQGKVSVKATTTEKLGFVGKEDGISAYCVVLLEKMN